MKKRTRVALAAAAAAAALTAYAAAPGVARTALIRDLDRRGWDASVQSVSLAWGGFTANGFSASSRDGSKQADLHSVKVDLGLDLKPKRVSASGGRIAIVGPWKASEGKSSGTGAELHVKGVQLSWKNADGAGASIEAKSASADASGGTIEVRLESMEMTSKWGSAASDLVELKKGASVSAKTPSMSAAVFGNSVRLDNVVVSKLSLRGDAAEISAAADFAHLPWDLSASGLKIDISSSIAGGVVKADISASAESFSGQHRAVSAESISTSPVKLSGSVTARLASEWSADFKLSSGGAAVDVLASKQEGAWSIAASMDSKCSDVLSSIPAAMKQELFGLEVSGDIKAHVRAEEKNGVPDAAFELKNRCRVDRVPDQVQAALSGKSFTRTVYSGTGKPKDVSVSIGWAGWAPLASISPYMAKAVVTTEDPGFWTHKGIDVEAVRNSIRDNVKERRFLRGASTIPMQLAKNLFLSREKTASRKVQEFFLTMVLDQKMSKDRILEAYLNVIEFGPDVYGIHQAARYYFDTDPASLSLAQSAFLASILPKPRAHYFGTDGKLHEARRNYVNLILDLMLKRNSITDEECRAGKEEDVSMGGSDSSRGVDASDWEVQ